MLKHLSLFTLNPATQTGNSVLIQKNPQTSKGTQQILDSSRETIRHDMQGIHRLRRLIRLVRRCLTWRGRGLSKSFISRVIIGVTPFRVLTPLLITYLLSPLPLQVFAWDDTGQILRRLIVIWLSGLGCTLNPKP